jgi:hypothetical protein
MAVPFERRFFKSDSNCVSFHGFDVGTVIRVVLLCSVEARNFVTVETGSRDRISYSGAKERCVQRQNSAR